MLDRYMVGRLIDLWLEDADVVLAGSPDETGDGERRAAIWTEALAIWPDPEVAGVVAPFRSWASGAGVGLTADR